MRVAVALAARFTSVPSQAGAHQYEGVGMSSRNTTLKAMTLAGAFGAALVLSIAGATPWVDAARAEAPSVNATLESKRDGYDSVQEVQTRLEALEPELDALVLDAKELSNEAQAAVLRALAEVAEARMELRKELTAEASDIDAEKRIESLQKRLDALQQKVQDLYETKEKSK